MPSKEQVEGCSWLNEADLAVVAGEFARTGFQGGMQWYRSVMSGDLARGLALFAGRQIESPTLFIAGEKDWAAYQMPGAMEAMRAGLARDEVPLHFIEGAGHWLQQEQPLILADKLTAFLRDNSIP
jgi:pimeloyl-ACP methyl ester carboxylesterase